MPAKVLRDTSFRIEAPGENIKAEDKADWIQQVTTLLQTLKAEDDEFAAEKYQEKKLQRMCSSHWLLSRDWMLQVIAGFGLKAFQGTPSGVPVNERHRLSVCLDNGTLL